MTADLRGPDLVVRNQVLIFATPMQGYCFWVDKAHRLGYRRTDDGGASWLPFMVLAESVVCADVTYTGWYRDAVGLTIVAGYCKEGHNLHAFYRTLTIGETPEWSAETRRDAQWTHAPMISVMTNREGEVWLWVYSDINDDDTAGPLHSPDDDGDQP